MTSSSIRAVEASAAIVMRPVCRRPVSGLRIRFNYAVAMAITFMSCVILLVPEHPQKQASICQRHHSFEVCRVW